MIEAIGGHQAIELPAVALDHTLNQILAARHEYEEFGEICAMAPTDAEPVCLALSEKSGSTMALDYRGVNAPTAYEPVSFFGLGIVAKIDMAEVRARKSFDVSQQKLFYASEKVPDGFILWDADSRFVFCNQGFEEMRPNVVEHLTPEIGYEELIRCVIGSDNYWRQVDVIDGGDGNNLTDILAGREIDIIFSDEVAEVIAQHYAEQDVIQSADGALRYPVLTKPLRDVLRG